MSDYYDHLNDGEKYLCDKCEKVELTAEEYEKYIKAQFRYCEGCWNYIHLKKGNCPQCKNYYTNRSERRTQEINCNCGQLVVLEVND